MSKASPTPLLIDTALLSAIISETLSIAGLTAEKKQACLNAAARRIVGDKHNWGFLTGQDRPVVAQAVSGYTISEPQTPALSASETAAPTMDGSNTVWPGVHIADYRTFVTSALKAPQRVQMIAGPLGMGMVTNLGQVINSVGNLFTEIRVNMITNDEIFTVDQDGQPRMRPEYWPKTEGWHHTVYTEVDDLSDQGIKALAREIETQGHSPKSGKIFLLTHNPAEFGKRVMQLAPRLMNRCMTVEFWGPETHPSIKEFMARSIDLAASTKGATITPSRKSWDKVTEIGAKIPNVPASAQDFLTYLNKKNADAKLLSFVEGRRQEIQLHFATGAVTPKALDDLGALLDRLKDIPDGDSLAHTARAFAMQHIRTHLSPFADQLIEVLHLDCT